jgi:pimeloyl-ACP methyl ester carboxylesterase
MNHIQNLKISNPVLIGHSFGGFLAMQLSAHHPATFMKLILIDSYPFAPGIYNPALTPEITVQQSVSIKKQLAGLSDNDYQSFWLHNVRQFTSDTLFQQLIFERILSSEKKFVIEAQSYVLSNDLRTELQKVRCPASVLCSSYWFKIAGLNEDMIRQGITDQFKYLNKCNIFIHAESKHFIMLDEKDWFLDTLVKVLDNQI